MRSRRSRIWGVIGVGFIVLVAGGLVHLFWSDRSDSGTDQATRRRLAALRTNPNPVARDLADGLIVEGGAVNDLVAKHEPSVISRHGPYTSMCFGDWPRVEVFAKDDRIGWALYTGDANAHCFFCSWSEQEQNDRQKSYETTRLNNCFEAVLGPATVPQELPREWLAREVRRRR